MTTYTQTYVICPWCEKQSGNQVCHLFGKGTYAFGPWYCRECGCAYVGSVAADNTVLVSRSGSIVPKFVKSLHLLRMPGTKTFFVLAADRLRDPGYTTAYDNCRYFYEEHSCPSNWMKDVVAVISDGDSDPHGFLEYVRFVDRGEPEEDEEYQDIFPEAFE